MSKVKRSSLLLPSAIIIYLRLLAVLGGKARRDHTLLSRLKIFLWLSLASATAPPQKFALTHTFLLYFLSWLPTSRMIVILWSALWYNCSKNTKVRCLSWTLKLWDLLRRCKKNWAKQCVHLESLIFKYQLECSTCEWNDSFWFART